MEPEALIIIHYWWLLSDSYVKSGLSSGFGAVKYLSLEKQLAVAQSVLTQRDKSHKLYCYD